MYKKPFFLLLCCAIFGTTLSVESAPSTKQDAANNTAAPPIWKSGASSILYNIAAGLPWKHEGGDWIDAKGTSQGPDPFATFQSVAPGRVVTDVTQLIKAYRKGTIDNQGVLIKGRRGSAIANFFSLESDSESKRPTLVISMRDGTQYAIPATADTHLDPTTRRSLGNRASLKLGGDKQTILIFFPIDSVPSEKPMAKAELLLHMSKRYGNKPVIADIYAIHAGGRRKKQPTQMGIAANYLKDNGLQDNPDVILAEKFERSRWTSDWSETAGQISLTSDTPLFTPIDGNALQVQFRKGTRNAANITYKFGEKLGAEPESVYFRYYIWLSEDWNPIVGGKFPGIAGTYGKAGWGGRKSDGFNGWSTRGAYRKPVGAINPLHGLTPIGTYAYTADMRGKYGKYWPWPIDLNGLLEKKRWYAIEQFVQLNTPGERDGILKSWVDGKLALDKRDIMYRKTDDLKIDRVWINFYHGGTTVIPTTQHLYIDNVVIAKKYIGPMRLN